MEPSCIICSVHMHDEELHMEWHRLLREVLQKMANSVFGKGFDSLSERIMKL